MGKQGFDFVPYEYGKVHQKTIRAWSFPWPWRINGLSFVTLENKKWIVQIYELEGKGYLWKSSITGPVFKSQHCILGFSVCVVKICSLLFCHFIVFVLLFLHFFTVYKNKKMVHKCTFFHVNTLKRQTYTLRTCYKGFWGLHYTMVGFKILKRKS